MRALKTAIIGCIAVGTLSAPSAAHATIIFNNFGPGDSFQTGIGWAIGGSLAYTQGDAFTVPGASDYKLDKIEFAVGNIGFPNALDVTLYSDNAGLPGSALESFHFSDAMGSFGLSYPPLVALSLTHPLLEGGAQYWVIASTTGSSFAAWNWNSTGDSGPHAYAFNGGAFSAGTNTTGAFRVEGTAAVPEPGSLLLLGTGLGALAARRRRRQGSH